PGHHTDFIFAVVGERWGFVGAAFVLSMYALLIWRGLRILTVSKNLFGAIVAGGIVAMLMFQVFVNVGMNVGIMPITGIPLPLFSYGGSSVLTTFLAVGLLQTISDLLKPGQEVVVQVVKDPLKTKGARLSMELTIAGRYMVYTPTGEGVGVSKRLDDKERERLRRAARGLDLHGGGAIIRTAASGAKRIDFERELQY